MDRVLSGEAIPHANHLVQFYEDDAFLYSVVADYAGDGLRNGEPFVGVATPEHRAGFLRVLRGNGFDVDALTASGRVRLLDARDLLDSFMRGDAPMPSASAKSSATRSPA
ncbi:MAG: MEDS domain-containing protein [Thermoanaerobaculia bacterium]